jgi:hypothetical protein
MLVGMFVDLAPYEPRLSFPAPRILTCCYCRQGMRRNKQLYLHSFFSQHSPVNSFEDLRWMLHVCIPLFTLDPTDPTGMGVSQARRVSEHTESMRTRCRTYGQHDCQHNSR